MSIRICARHSQTERRAPGTDLPRLRAADPTPLADADGAARFDVGDEGDAVARPLSDVAVRGTARRASDGADIGGDGDAVDAARFGVDGGGDEAWLECGGD